MRTTAASGRAASRFCRRTFTGRPQTSPPSSTGSRPRANEVATKQDQRIADLATKQNELASKQEARLSELASKHDATATQLMEAMRVQAEDGRRAEQATREQLAALQALVERLAAQLDKK
jgi:hypothetical protein